MSKKVDALKRATANQEMVAVSYRKPGRGIVTRHIRPYEVSVNRAGRPVVWGSDTIHGADQIHAFRLDRVASVVESKKPKKFEHSGAITRHLRSFDK